jgi:hypothetical protein
MAKAKKRRQQRGCCKITETIDRVEEAASMVVKIYRVIEPIVKAYLTSGRRTK